ncbi:hypothetical protein [Rhodopirellula halodulae]|uniref:hypothetical protein n=1 Tax=Rhodopirellula halodulae TaxID=2894198 RepID=UPI001E3E4527|nr:hypothetical protein [Rhodopirellula sp. JC737]MCC9658416.1 hypothetical protein [Rhodopirellula sp. JC737]
MKRFNMLFLSLSAVTLLGCGGQPVAESANESGGADSNYLASSEPTGAIPVGEAREKVSDGEELTLVGMVGGSAEPFVDGIAAFTVVDPKVPHCSSEEGCPTPWDYCCTQDQVKENIATIKVVDESGSPVPTTARELLGMKELSKVVVQGIAKRDEQGNLTVEASDVFVQSDQG